MRNMTLISATIVLFTVGCQPTQTSDLGVPVEFGEFEGEVVTQWHADGRLMTLQRDFAFIDSKKRKWVAPAGAVVNGASIPAAFWSFIGGPFEGRYRAASVIHDVGCVEMKEPWEDVHWMFYEACRCGGVDELDAKVMYYAVYHFGPRWERVVDTIVEPQMDATGEVVDSAIEVQRLARTDPPPPTPDELSQIESFIAEENPTIDDIQVTQRSELRRRPRRSKSRQRASEEPQDRVEESGEQPVQGLMSGSLAHARSTSRQTRPNAVRTRLASSSMPTGLSENEQQWVANIARQYIETQAGEERPANYLVDRARGAYRVTIEYLALNEENQWQPYEGGVSTIIVSRHGQILESVSN